MVAQIITIMTPAGRTGDEPRLDAGETRERQPYRRQHFGHAEEELKPARERGVNISTIVAGGKRNRHPWAKNASASNTWSTQSRIFMPTLLVKRPAACRAAVQCLTVTGRMRLGPIDIRIILRQMPSGTLAAFLDTRRGNLEIIT